MATVFALSQAWGQRPLVIYFAANLAYEVLTEIPFVLDGDTAPSYWIAYAALTALWLAAAAWLTWTMLPRSRSRLKLLAIPAMLAVVMSRLVYVGIGHVVEPTDWIVLLEGGVLYGCALALCGASLTRPQGGDISMILYLLWFAQCAFKWGYVLNLPEAAWITRGYWMPTCLCTAAFTLIGIRLRRERQAALHMPLPGV